MAHPKQDWLHRASLVGLVGLAALLRSYRLAEWSFYSDELNTLRDSLGPVSLEGSRQLLFLLNHYLVGTWTQLDEFTLRLLPAIFGVLSVVAVYWAAKRAFSGTAGLLTALLVTVAPWQVYWSQYARYWTLAFFLTALYPILVYLGWKERRVTLIVGGVGVGILAVLAHPATGLVLAAVGLWLAVTVVFEFRRHGPDLDRRLVAGLLVAGIVCIFLVGNRLGPQLVGWYYLPQTWGHQGWLILGAYAAWMSPVVLLLSAGGITWLWFEKDRHLSSLLIFTIVIPAAGLVVLSYVVPVSALYLLPTAPAAFLAAGIFLDKLGRIGPEWRGISLVQVVCVVVALAATMPSLMSHYLDGGRPNMRAAAQFLEREAQPGDLVVSDWSRTTKYYLSGQTVLKLDHVRQGWRSVTTNEQLASSVATGREITPAWIVLSVESHGGFSETDLGPAESWVRNHCRLRLDLYRPRLDFRRYEVEVYRCPSPGPLRLAAKAGRPR